jgi:hypothetical protein
MTQWAWDDEASPKWFDPYDEIAAEAGESQDVRPARNIDDEGRLK